MSGAHEIPGCIARTEPAADYGWFSTRRLLITKDAEVISLSADDLRRLFAFVDANRIDEQISL